MGKDLNLVEVTLTVGGQPCFFVYMKLHQGFNCHHHFEVTVDYEELDTKWMESPEKIIQLIGQDANIEMKHKDGTGVNLFQGVITHVSFVGHHGAQNQIKISGCSPTIKLDGTKTMDSFMDKPLNAIVSEAVGNSGNGGSVTPSPKFSGDIDYIAQYEESCFEFLNRLSWIYGEWFFYDGVTCNFGKPGGGGGETVTFESEITLLNLSANLAPSKMKRYHYLVHDDKETDKDAPDSVPGVKGYHETSKGKSSSVYSSDAVLPSEAVVKTEKELEDLAKAEKTRSVAGMLTLSGTSQTSKVKIGKPVTVKLPTAMKTTKKEVGEFLVIEVTHEYEQKGGYQNTFTAIPSEMENIPMNPVSSPKAYPQIATVKTNEDEKKLGRVKIEFQWQKAKGKTTNWIRVQTPDAGKSDEVPKNRGMVFIPEKDDIVMIGFEYGDPNRPYVAGSIFSEKVSIGGDDGNKIKSITTRTGCTITIDDSDGSILIQDHKDKKVYQPLSKSKINLDGKQNIIIDAATSISLTSGKANITLMSEGDGTITMSAKTILIDAGETFDVKSKKVISLDSKDTLSAGSKTKSTLSSSMETVVSGQMKTTVTATGQTVIDGAIVKIN